jgi:hypothetical protein
MAINLYVGAVSDTAAQTVPAKYFYGQLLGFFSWNTAGVCTQRLVAVNDVRGSAATNFVMSTVVTAGSTTASRVRFQITSNAVYVRFVSAGVGLAGDISVFEYRVKAGTRIIIYDNIAYVQPCDLNYVCKKNLNKVIGFRMEDGKLKEIFDSTSSYLLVKYIATPKN